MKFLDVETIVIYIKGYYLNRQGFYIVAANLKGNSERIFVVQAGTE